jgi:hypothetical protein
MHKCGTFIPFVRACRTKTAVSVKTPLHLKPRVRQRQHHRLLRHTASLIARASRLLVARDRAFAADHEHAAIEQALDEVDLVADRLRRSPASTLPATRPRAGNAFAPGTGRHRRERPDNHAGGRPGDPRRDSGCCDHSARGRTHFQCRAAGSVHAGGRTISRAGARKQKGPDRSKPLD